MTTTISVIGETVFGVLLCPSFIEMMIVMGAAQVLVLFYALLGSSAKLRGAIRRIFRASRKGADDE